MPSHLSLLLRLEARRLADPFRHPRLGTWLAVLLPAVLVLVGLWLAGEQARPDLASGDGRILFGFLVSAPVALQAYPLLFRPADDAFLRRLGVPGGASFLLRALRLLALALGVIAVALIPFVATGSPLGLPLAVASVAGLVSWAVALWAHARAADTTVNPNYRPGLLAMTMALDRELVDAAPLVFAPIWPVVAGGMAALLAGISAGTLPLRVAAMIVLVTPLIPLAVRRFARATPRFSPHAGELAYAPPPGAGESELVIGRGWARVLPRRAGVVRARDAVVVDRRFRWAGRAVWPVAIFSVLALVRAGDDPEVRGWVTAACALLLLAQAAAVIALGRLERGRLRWIDRALGLRMMDRLVGRWATAFGLALGVAIPVALAWAANVPAPSAWWWLVGAAAVAALASGASVAAAGR
ncbi:MAG TPA: hypothetical protein VHG91_16355 [Longimicrobium sp.]|nr:hypothetical protein [Longimicrobium sp.]